MPKAKGEPIGRQRENLSIFGEWFYFFCDYFEVSMYSVAKRSGLLEGKLSQNTKDPAKVPNISAPSRKTITRLVATFAQIAEERHEIWLQESGDMLYHSAGFASEEECQYAEKALFIVQKFADRKRRK